LAEAWRGEGGKGGSMMRAWWTFVLFLTAMSALAQTHTPKLIDVHMHYDGEPGILDQVLVKLEDVDGIAFLLTTQKGFPQANKFIQEHPDRFIGFGDIKLDDPEVLHQIDRFHAAGFRGLGEITMTRKAYDDPAYWPIYDRADKYHMILLFHTGIVNRLHPEQPADVSFDRSRVTRLDLIARHWPNLTIIGAHLGNPDYEEAAEIGRWNPNLYFDASGTTLIKKKADYRFFQSIFWWTAVASPHTPVSGASAFEKLVFGSDVFGGELDEFDSAQARYHAMLDDCEVPQSVQAKIFSGTMWHILQLQQAQALSKPVIHSKQ
jgi:predicted TIM-barrel fold metal-dependent hydrolase